MDLLIIILFLVAVLLIARHIRSPGFKGSIGESKVKIFGGLSLSTSTYRPVHDVTIPTPKGTTQIDHVYISKYGVFVVETKNYQGWIFGSENQKNWTQVLYGDKYKLLNPLRQNHWHVLAVQRALDLTPEKTHSVVVFVGDSTFKTPMPANVTTTSGFARYIKSFRTEVLTEEEVLSIERRIKERAFTTIRASSRPTEADRSLRTRGSDQSTICPRCGSPLTRRIARNGPKAGSEFWGCSAFPRCRYTRNI